MAYVIAYDIGTTGVKTCLFEVKGQIRLITSANKGYQLYILDNGGAEQDCDEWWQAMCETTKELFTKCDVKPWEIDGISFCSQMQGLVLVDSEGKALRRPMSYMDQRAKKEIKEGIAYGFQIAGANVPKLLKSLYYTGAVSSSVKDPVWKYKWVENNEPELFKKVYKWLDVKEYLIGRCTDELVMTQDTAYSTFLYSTRKGKERFEPALMKLYGVNPKHLPRIVKTTDCVGGLTDQAAKELGLTAGTKVFGGGGDATLIGVGAGCTKVGDTHVYSGTSGWVTTIVDKQTVDANAMIAAIVGAQSGKFNYFAEMETAGKCLEWARNHLALDEIDIYQKKIDVKESRETAYQNLYDYLTDAVREVPVGSGDVIFTPWLHGNRCPFEDPGAAGMFFNIKLETGKAEMIRAVLEGVCYHLCWMLECQDKKVKTNEVLRFVGGGALSDVTCQILADVTGRRIEVVADPQDVGAVGAAAVVGVGIGEIGSLEEVSTFIPVEKTFEPDAERTKKYAPLYQTFKKIYKTNKKLFAELNS